MPCYNGVIQTQQGTQLRLGAQQSEGNHGSEALAGVDRDEEHPGDVKKEKRGKANQEKQKTQNLPPVSCKPLTGTWQLFSGHLGRPDANEVTTYDCDPRISLNLLHLSILTSPCFSSSS